MNAGPRDAEAARDPYGTFLRSADVPTWRACAHHAGERVRRAAGDDRCRALADALCITAYLSWLGRVSGDPDTQAEANARYRDLLTVLDELSASAVGPGIDRCWGIALAWQGYRVRARTLLEDAGALGVESAPLVLPENDVTALATLRPLVAAAAPGGSFLPAVSILASSLVNVGAVREAHALVDACGWPPTEPLLVDVLGSAFERLGQWKAAYEVYKTSTWPSLRYRAAITSAITGGSTPLEIDAATIAMLTEQVELDQRQISRWVTFLNAVRWQPVDSWLLELEMGKLAFAQRRDAEADMHLRRAAERAPEAARYGVASARWVNLTWLTGNELFTGLEMLPETLTAAEQAMAAAGPGDTENVLFIRMWTAEKAGDLELIPEDLQNVDPFQRGVAYRVLEDSGRAVDSWLVALHKGDYYHRTVTELVGMFAKAGFSRTVRFLADTGMQESSTDFLALWEIARTLDTVAVHRSAADLVDEGPMPEDVFRDRLVDQSRLEFKNSLRTYELVSDHDPDLADQVLRRAVDQAAGVSELLAVVRLLRRRPTATGIVSAADDGLRCLWRALNEARDRLERLLIARELLGYGLPRDARALLEREGVLQADTLLTHVETTVLLSCYRLLSADERAGLVGRAVRRIVADHRAGLLGAAAPTYGQRLVAILEAVDRDLAPQVRARLGPELVGDRPATEWHGHPVDDAASVTSRLDFLASEDVRRDIGVERLTHEVAQRFPEAATSFGLRLTVATELRDRYRSLIDQARTVRPSVPREAVPIAYDHDGDGDRTIVLCDRLRARLAASDDLARKAAEEQLAAFRLEERVLVEQWDRLQREARFGALQSAASYGHALAGSLRDLVGPQERACPHPVLKELFGHVANDVGALVAHVQEQLLLIEQELRDPSGPPAVIPA